MKQCHLHRHALLLLASLVLSFNGGGAVQASDRIVVTLTTYNACATHWWTNADELKCATLSKCYGRRLVLNIRGCLEPSPSLLSMDRLVETLLQKGSSLQLDDGIVIASVEQDLMMSTSETDMLDYEGAHASMMTGRGAQLVNASLIDAYNHNMSIASSGGVGTAEATGVKNPDNLDQWNLDMINAPNLWSRGYDGFRSVVAVLDSGLAASSIPIF
jgi:hypothetical protein